MASFSPTIGKFGDVTSRQKPWTRWYKKHKLALYSTIAVVIISATAAGGWWVWQAQQQPAAGGVLEEGIVGQPQRLNPLYSNLNPVDAEITPLIFRGLLKYDQNQRLVGDLAQSWKLSDDGKVYTITLADNKWHDGQPVTSQDVAFTIAQAQDDNYNGSWSHSFTDVSVKVLDSKNLTLTLNQTSGPFAQYLTIGLLPHHVLKDMTAAQLASSAFNAKPMGNGPLKYKSTEADSINKDVSTMQFELQNGYLEAINFHFYDTLDEVITDFKLGKIQSFGSHYTTKLSQLNDFDKQQQSQALQGQTYGLYFNLNSATVKDVAVRQALSQSIDKSSLLNQALGNNWQAVNNVFSPTNWANSDTIKPLEYDLNKAKETWQTLSNKPPKITLVIPDKDTHTSVANSIVKAWQQLGVSVTVLVKEGDELNQLITNRTGYDVILLGEKTRQDPDRYTNWHSTQTPPTGLNVAGLNNQRIDRALEDGRRLIKEDERKVKYTTFQNLLNQELPVIWLYQPSYVYTWSNKVYGLEMPGLWTESDRFANIDKWYLNLQRQN